VRPVAIIGAQAITQEAFTGARLEEVVFDTTAAALEDAGVVREELDSVVLGASDELDGRSITSMLLAMPAGAFLKDEIRTTSGMHALALQAMRIQSGIFDLGIAVSWSKPSETSSVASVQWTSLDPFVGRDLGLIDPIASAVMATVYLERFGRNRGDLDRRSEEKARSGAGHSSDEIASTTSGVSYPFRAEHLASIIDGVTAVVVASPSMVERLDLSRPPVWLRGLGWATDSYLLSERTLWEWSTLRRVANDALDRAGCQVEEIDRFEIDDYSVMHEVLAVEALGLAAPGSGFDYLSAAEENGRQINPTGGSFGGYPPVCAGLWRVVEAYRHLRDGGVKRALAHGTTGIAAQGHEVAVLERG
jgi:acetyl-CoA acetyltransferase